MWHLVALSHTPLFFIIYEKGVLELCYKRFNQHSPKWVCRYLWTIQKTIITSPDVRNVIEMSQKLWRRIQKIFILFVHELWRGRLLLMLWLLLLLLKYFLPILENLSRNRNYRFLINCRCGDGEEVDSAPVYISWV